ncbi:PREDICTED: probable cytochrome P450 6a13 [Dinoponera quadriceps]|uniref:Probable cytochrome P450 6a13 n=1 Tax=Dinoponera quadriceps TaxID=609295 RepID=A0A6P3XBA7_DINQU|nr:PREDICTED: probable cytochrome P450 6a13 [Dinoponera quadriceps]
MFPYNILFGCAAILLALGYYVIAKYNYWKARGVKGPKPLPIVGNFGRIIAGKMSLGDFLKEIYVKYRGEPLIGIYSGLEPILVVKDPAFIKDVLIKDFSVFADRGIHVNDKIDTFGTNLFSIDAKRWRLIRAKLSPTFSSSKLRDMFYLLVQCSNNFSQYMDRQVQQESVINSRKITSKFTADVIGTCAFGIDLKTLNDEDCEFLQMARKMMQPSMKAIFKDFLRRMTPQLYDLIGHLLTNRHIERYFIKIVMDTIEYRTKHNIIKHDFVDILQDLKKHPEKLPEIELTDNMIVAQAIAFFIAGFFASSISISHVLYELALYPEMQKQLREEIMKELEKTNGVIEYDSIKSLNYLDAIFKETLRKYPPVTHIMRKSVADYTFSGTQVHIPQGQHIWIPLYPIHTDPKIYPNPEIFDPERFMKGNSESVNPSTYLPFGNGPRNCIGARFGTYQTKVGIIEIVKNFQINTCEKTVFQYGKQSRSFILAPQDGPYLRFTKINRGYRREALFC